MLCDRWYESGAHAEYRASLIATSFINVHLRPEITPLEKDHFMRHPFKKQPTEIEEISPELMHERLKYAFGAPDPDPVEQSDAGGVS